MKNNLFILILFLSVGLNSQDLDTFELKSRYGGYFNGGLDLNISSFSKLPEVPNCCSEFSFTTGQIFSIGFVYEKPINYKWGFSGRLGFSYHLTNFKESEAEVLNDNGSAVNGSFDHILTTDLSIINIKLNSYYYIIPKLDIQGGFLIGILSSGNFYQREEISNNTPNFTFLDTPSRIRNEFSNSIEDLNPLQFGFNIGASYQLALNKSGSLYLYPEIFYNGYFTNVAKNTSWVINSVSGGFSIKYRQAPPPPPPPPPPPNPIFHNNLKLPEKPPVLSANFTISQFVENKRDNSKGLKIEDFISLNMRPLLNYIFFEENSSEIADRYNTISRSQISNFNFSSLRNLNHIETYYHVLNIYGFRMFNDPNENITLIGCNSDHDKEKQNIGLSRARAKKVKDYLTNVWMIDSSRIKIKARNLPSQASRSDTITGLQENRRVEIISSVNLAGSIRTFDTLRVIKDTRIVVEPKIKSKAGITNWNLKISQGKLTIKEFQGTGDLPKQIDWNLNSKSKELSNIRKRLNFLLQVEDQIGQKYTTKPKSLAIEQLTIDRKRLEKRKDKEFEYYSLILFPYGKSNLGPEHLKTVDFVKSRISENSNVRILGYSDSVGDEQINKRIATSRAKNVYRRLNDNDAEVVGVGESSLLYDNSLPEGRFYCRTVRIEIETEIGN